ncbi:ragulator complex protein LAMTOR5 homolog [Anabrus simplex]|uniref:ragulator complex protein LAMTOR5 homolog n=1 Tax=Anabrus simplex TaxID=316456 RepID=UPI0034DD12A0
METQLEQCMDDLLLVRGVTGCILADDQGLCLCAKGKVSPASSGVIKAIADQVLKLEPELKPPVIVLESENRECLIQQCGNLTAAIHKTLAQ